VRRLAAWTPTPVKSPTSIRKSSTSLLPATTHDVNIVLILHRYFSFDSPARAEDLNLQDTKAYGGPNHLTAGIQHGSWSIHTKPGQPPKDSFVTSSQTDNIREDLSYTKEDIAAVEEWVKRHVETTWHSKPIPTPLPSSTSPLTHITQVSAPAAWPPKKATR